MDPRVQERHHYVEHLLKNCPSDYPIGKPSTRAIRVLTLRAFRHQQLLSVTSPRDQFSLPFFSLVLGVWETCTASVQQHNGNGGRRRLLCDCANR